MKTKLIITFITFLYAASSFASISGKWVGMVDWIQTDGGAECVAYLTVYEDENTYSVTDRLYEFHSGMQYIQPDRYMKKKNSKLSGEDILDGRFTENKFVWRERVGIHSMITVEITKVNNVLEYKEVEINSEGVVTSRIIGKLVRRD
jgi:hypothetical protein